MRRPTCFHGSARVAAHKMFKKGHKQYWIPTGSLGATYPLSKQTCELHTRSVTAAVHILLHTQAWRELQRYRVQRFSVLTLRLCRSAASSGNQLRLCFMDLVQISDKILDTVVGV